MQGKRGHDITEARRIYATQNRPTKHPGSKRGRMPADHKSAGKSNAWKAMTRPLRRYPGWKKRLVKRVQAGDFSE